MGLLGWATSYKLDPVLVHVSLKFLGAKGKPSNILFMPMQKHKKDEQSWYTLTPIHILLAEEDIMIQSRIKSVEKYNPRPR